MSETKKKPAAKAKPEHKESNDSKSVVVIKGKPLSTRGRTFVGKVISNKMSKTVTVEWERKKYITKYQRYEKRRTRVKAHDEFNCKIGAIVEIVETRPISKTKNFLVTRIISSE